MSDEIQVGDVVECVDGIPGSGIETGSTYRVLRADHRFLYFNPKNEFSGWYRDRFRKVEPPVVTPWTPKPDVHCGGPYVARSEYERVCAELESLKAAKPADPVDAPPLYLITEHIRCIGWLTIDEDGEACLRLQKPELRQDLGLWTNGGKWIAYIGEATPPKDWKRCIWKVNTLGAEPVVIEEEAE